MVARPRPPQMVTSQRVRDRWPWVAVGGLILACGLTLVRAPYRSDAPCPTGGRTIEPTAVRLVPSVMRHQSWLEVPSNALSVGMKLFACTDGRLVGENLMDEYDLIGSVTQVGIPTNWVASMWLAGRLDEYRSPDRWAVIVDPRVPAPALPMRPSIP